MRERFIELEADEKLIVTYKQQAQQPSIEQPKDKGALKYSVGLVSDLHFDTDHSTKHDSEYAEDFGNAIDYFRNRNVDFIACPGDLCEYENSDLYKFNEVYTDRAWGPTGGKLRFFTALGNHDYLRLFKKGQDLESLSQTFRPFSGEDLWKIYGYADKNDYIQFFEYDGQWNRQKTGNRTVKSKLNYWVELFGDIYVFLSIDYGEDTGEVWDEQARGYHMLDKNNKYVKQMVEYVSDTNYSSENGSLDYQFYHPNTLIWLKDILDNNNGKRIFVFMHHFLPHKAGDSDGLCSHLRIWPYSESNAVRQKYYYGSNTPCGLTFWFLDKLTNEYPNAIWFSGHSHREWNDLTSFCRHDYVVRKPTGNEVTPLTDNLESLTNTQYDYRLYTRQQPEQPCGHSAWTIGLPSLSKPISVDGQTLYCASQGGVIEVYENGIVVKCVEFKRQGESSYRNEVVKTIEL